MDRIPHRQSAVMVFMWTAAIIVGSAITVSAQTPQIEIMLRDTSGYPGQTIFMPVYVATGADTLFAYQVSYGVDRPNVVRFDDTTVTDTFIICADPPACSQFDTTIEVQSRVLLDASGTLSESWNYLAAVILGSSTNLKITGFSDIDFDRNPPGVLPMTNGVLIRFPVHIECHPDPFNGGEAILQPNLLVTSFSTPDGQSIVPFSSTGATITILDPAPCDLDFSGYADAIDFGMLIQCIFYSSCPDCDAVNTDYNCDGVTDALDFNIMIDYLFFGAAAPTPCP